MEKPLRCGRMLVKAYRTLFRGGGMGTSSVRGMMDVDGIQGAVSRGR
jgi:hypothetical protein